MLSLIAPHAGLGGRVLQATLSQLVSADSFLAQVLLGLGVLVPDMLVVFCLGLLPLVRSTIG